MARPRQISDAEILQSARSCFLEQGPSASTNCIAERLGISQATLFKRFGTKEDLLVAALVPAPPAWLDGLDDGPDDRPFQAQLRQVLQEMEAFMRETMPRMQCLVAAGIGIERAFRDHEIPPPLLTRNKLTAWFQRAMDAGKIIRSNPATLATALMGSVHARSFLQGALERRGQDSASAMPKPPQRLNDTYLDELEMLIWRAVRIEEEDSECS